jgi:hypothetical protein
MLRKIIIAILSIYLIYILSQSFFKLFEWNVEVISHYKQWAKVLDIKTHKETRIIKGAGDSYQVTTWSLTIKIKDKTPVVTLSVGPPPKIGGCVPVIADELSNGNIIASIDNEEWRYGTTYGRCD